MLAIKSISLACITILFAGLCQGQQLKIAASSSPNQPFNSYLLNMLELGLHNSPDLRARYFQVNASEYLVSAAKWQLAPTPFVTAEKARQGDYRGDTNMFKLGLQQPLWTGGRLTANISKAEAQNLTSVWDFADAKDQWGTKLVQAYAEYIAASKKLKIYKISIDEHSKLLVIIKNRVDAGVSPASDIDLASSRLEQAISEAELMLTQKKIALNKLNQLVGIDVSVGELDRVIGDKRDWALVFLSPSELSDIRSHYVLEKNPKILKAIAEMEIAEAEESESKSNLQPDIYLRIERQVNDFAIPNAPPQNRVVVGLNSRFGAGLSSFSEIKNRQSRKESLQANIDSAKKSLYESIQSDLDAIDSSSKRLVSSSIAEKFSFATYESWKRQFFVGKKSWQDLMNSIREYNLSANQVADIEANMIMVMGRLKITTTGIENLIGK